MGCSCNFSLQPINWHWHFHIPYSCSLKIPLFLALHTRFVAPEHHEKSYKIPWTDDKHPSTSIKIQHPGCNHDITWLLLFSTFLGLFAAPSDHGSSVAPKNQPNPTWGLLPWNRWRSLWGSQWLGWGKSHGLGPGNGMKVAVPKPMWCTRVCSAVITWSMTQPYIILHLGCRYSRGSLNLLHLLSYLFVVDIFVDAFLAFPMFHSSRKTYLSSG